MLTRQDWERAKGVADDLEYLIDSWKPTLDERQLKRDSPLLRRLLVDREYARAWRDLGLPGQPLISAPDFKSAVGQTTLKYLQFATSPPGLTVSNSLLSGGKIKIDLLEEAAKGSMVALVPGYGQQFGLMVTVIPPAAVANEAATGKDLLDLHVRPGQRHVVTQPVSEFLQSTFAVLLGIKITRQLVIQYVANKLGGVHFDSSRKRKGDDKLELLDRFSKVKLTVEGGRPTSAVYLELLSIAEWLAESRDAVRFRRQFDETPEPE